MDPLSILGTSIAIIEIAGSTTKKLIELREAYKRLDKELQGLDAVITSLGKTFQHVQDVVRSQDAFLRQASGDEVRDLLLELQGSFDQADELVDFLHIIISDLQGDPNVKLTFKRLDKFRRVIRREKREDEINDIRSRITNCQSAIEMSLAALNIFALRAVSDSVKDAVGKAQISINDNTNDQLSRMELRLASMVSQLSDDMKNASAAAKISESLRVNEYFGVSQAVTPFFTGREDLIAELKDAFHVTDPEFSDPLQLKFVVSGVAGSGKSQFSIRFAAEVRKNFWGIFFVDASSPDTAENDFARIANYGQQGATSMKAAMHWLASRSTPWLLIIDNADNVKNIQDYFPAGGYGRILVTTRDPALQALGNAGKGHYHFDELKHDDAEELLLRAAQVKMPCLEQTILKAAKEISEKMHYLPLALNFAGSIIRQRLSTWNDYLTWYKKEQKKSALRRKEEQKKFGSRKDWAKLRQTSPATFHNFEALVAQMSDMAEDPDPEISRRMQDATDLLNLFAFFHHRNIRLDVLLQAIENPAKEKKLHADKAGSKDVPRRGARTSIKARVVDRVEKVRGLPIYGRLCTPPAMLPAVLRDHCYASDEAMEDAKARIRLALRELASRSLISYHDEDDVFSIHPLIHSFCRARLGDSVGALWCEVAQVVLARCVVIEEKLFTGGKSDFFDARHLLTHVEECRRASDRLREAFEHKWNSRAFLEKPFWSWQWPYLKHAPAVVKPFFEDVPPAHDLARWIKFSVIYFQCAKLRECYQLQRPIRDISVTVRGLDHEVSILLSLATSITCHFLGEFQTSVFLQRQAVEGCIELYGQDHARTLRYRDGLAMMLLAAGRLREASQNVRLAYEGLLAHAQRGPLHRDTLMAMSHFALVEMMYFRHEHALELVQRAVKGLQAADETETDILDAQQVMAMCFTRLGGKHLDEAYHLQQAVLMRRVELEGKENPHALLALLQYTRVLLEKGDYHEAEMHLRWGIDVGIRDLGEEHYGVQAAQSTLARICEAQGKVAEAEELFIHVNLKLLILRERNKHDHVDRIGHLWYFMKFYEGQQRYEKALAVHKELLEAVEKVDQSYTDQQLGKRHKMHSMLLERLPKLQQALEEQRSTPTITQSPTSDSPIGADSNLRKRVPPNKAPMPPIDVKAANDRSKGSVSSERSSLASPPPAYDDHQFSRQHSLERRDEKPMSFRRVQTDPVYHRQ